MQHYEQPKNLPNGSLPPGADEAFRSEDIRERTHLHNPLHVDAVLNKSGEPRTVIHDVSYGYEEVRIPQSLDQCTNYKEVMYWAGHHYDPRYPSRTLVAVQEKLREMGDRASNEPLTREEILFLDRYGRCAGRT